MPEGVLTTTGLPLQDSGEVFQRRLTGLSGLLLRMDGAGASVGVNPPKHLKTPTEAIMFVSTVSKALAGFESTLNRFVSLIFFIK